MIHMQLRSVVFYSFVTDDLINKKGQNDILNEIDRKSEKSNK